MNKINPTPTLPDSMHPHEKALARFQVDGAAVDLVEWQESLWCGKIRYAPGNTGEPDVEKLMEEFVALGDADLSPVGPEPGWDVCMSFNYLSGQRPSGVFFGFRVESRAQPQGFDLRWLPGGQYLRVEINEQTARALEKEPWQGGVPPYQWICQSFGPRLGFACEDSGLPITEYYRHAADGSITGCWMYVPVTGRLEGGPQINSVPSAI
ncbi:hypothetical protein [Acutalibacter caecimuris]|uniref:hypothetical protein n=1 Tax=Acutalibacter caecimuris TaxID=3093657 RepID=UPI002AC89BC7|nr:hypothetical protein [Acutalibacter sp. M00118]